MHLVALSALASALLWTAVRAQGGEDEYDDKDIEEDSLSDGQLRSLHSKFDKDGNGKVSLAEVMSFAHEMSKSIASRDIQAILDDIDVSPKDGRLSLEEHLTDIHNQADGADEESQNDLVNRKQVEADKFRAADQNGDQHLDADEVVFLYYPETNDDVLKLAVEETMAMKDKSGDGRLSPHEFWEVDAMAGDDGQLSEEELQEFTKLDASRDGFVDINELRFWESGRFHTEESMKKLFELADANNDMHLSAAELTKAREAISESDAQHHLLEWAEHNEL